MTAKQIFFGIGLFVAGMILAPKGQISTCPTCNENLYKTQYEKVVEIDNEGFGYCADFGQITSEAFKAGANLDVATISKKTEEMNALNTKIEAWSATRTEFFNNVKK